MNRFDRLQGPIESEPMTAIVQFYYGPLFSQDWKSEKFRVPTEEVCGKTRWDSPEYDEAFRQAQAHHDAHCEATTHDIRISMSFNY